jgi:nucleotide-binding universal stress UspA family protein
VTSPTLTPSELATTYAQVLMPIDFSPLSWRVLSLANAMEEGFGVPRRLVHVDSASPWVDDGINRLTMQTEPHGKHVEVDVIAGGTAADGIVRALGDDESSLLVMSTHSHAPLAELRFGSTAEAVLRGWRGPVLLAGPRFRATQPAVTRIVLCVEPMTEPPRTLVVDVAAWSRHLRVPVDLLVIDDDTTIDFDAMCDEKQHTKLTAQALLDLGVSTRSVYLQDSRVAHAISSYADARAGTVIALATRARGLATRLLLGSVAMTVVRRASSPVLVRRYERRP